MTSLPFIERPMPYEQAREEDDEDRGRDPGQLAAVHPSQDEVADRADEQDVRDDHHEQQLGRRNLERRQRAQRAAHRVPPSPGGRDSAAEELLEGGVRRQQPRPEPGRARPAAVGRRSPGRCRRGRPGRRPIGRIETRTVPSSAAISAARAVAQRRRSTRSPPRPEPPLRRRPMPASASCETSSTAARLSTGSSSAKAAVRACQSAPPMTTSCPPSPTQRSMAAALRLGQAAAVAGPDDGRQPAERLGALRDVSSARA